jgi:hypothetical protein
MKVPRAKWFSVGRAGEPYPARLRELDGRSGCYLIRPNGGRVAYVGESHTGRLRKTLTRHFQDWKRGGGKKADFWREHYGQQHDPGTTYDRGRCEVAVFLTSPANAKDLEIELIRRYRPTDNLADVPF